MCPPAEYFVSVETVDLFVELQVLVWPAADLPEVWYQVAIVYKCWSLFWEELMV